MCVIAVIWPSFGHTCIATTARRIGVASSSGQELDVSLLADLTANNFNKRCLEQHLYCAEVLRANIRLVRQGGTMATIAAEEEPEAAVPAPWPVKDAMGRIGRWLFFGVLLAVIPVVISFLWLPKNSSVTTLLSHGDLAVIASALVGISMGELIGPDEPQRWIRNVLMSSCILLLLGSVVLLALIASHAGRFSPNQEVDYSWILFFVSVALGIVSMAATVRRA